jgi:hypothetical protein
MRMAFPKSDDSYANERRAQITSGKFVKFAYSRHSRSSLDFIHSEISKKAGQDERY